jgi:membrane protease YdiL (CAAX protease family)
MLDVPSASILLDLSIFVSIATALALFGYRLMRHYRPQFSWNHEGQVLSRPYSVVDLIVLSMLGLFFILAIKPHATAAATAAGGGGGVTMGALVFGMAFHLIACAALLIYLHRIRGLNPAELFGLQRIHWRSLGVVVLVFTVIVLITVNLLSAATVELLKDVWPDLQPQETVKAFRESDSFLFQFLVVVAAVVVAPLAEETLFRGFVYGVLKRYTDAPFAALASSLMFAIVHVHVGSLLPLCVLAVLFCIAYEISGCLLAPMLLHAVFNTVSILGMLFLQPAS